MRIPVEWLKNYVDLEMSPEELAHRLTMAGLEVDSVSQPGAALDKVVVGRIAQILPHPQADHLLLLELEVGDDDILRIVSGAPNLATGLLVAVALPGALLPSGMVIEKAVFRGIESEGMLLSARELGLDEALVSPENRGGVLTFGHEACPGRKVASHLGLDEPILEVEVTPNRADCLGLINLAREVRAITGANLHLPLVPASKPGGSCADLALVDIWEPELCRRYVARIMREVRVGPSPWWLARRLMAAGIRPINNVVDVTNYVMLETNQPLHAFDFDRLQGRRITVRRAHPGELLATLDDQEHHLEPEDLVIADAEGAVALAGVMGGLASGVWPETTTILLESANFHPGRVRRTARRVGLHSEAAARFERGVSASGALPAADRAIALLAEIGAAIPVDGHIDCYPRPVEERRILLRLDRLDRVLGDKIPRHNVNDYLRRLDLDPAEVDRDRLEVRIPAYRTDLAGEIDLIEEVARLHGYDRLPVTIPAGVSLEEPRTPRRQLEDKLRPLLQAAGLTEVITYSFQNQRALDRLRLPPAHPLRRAPVLLNPLSEEQGVLRTSMLPGLLEVASRNLARRVDNVPIFEIGRVFWSKSGKVENGQTTGDSISTELPEEKPFVAALTAGNQPGGWDWPENKHSFFWHKGLIETIISCLGLERSYDFLPHPGLPAYHPGRAAVISVSQRLVGELAELHPEVTRAFGIPERSCYWQLNLEELTGILQERGLHERRYQPLPRFPSVSRDVSLVLPEFTPAAAVERLIRQTGGELLRLVDLKDVYQGEPVASGYRSLTYSLVYRAEERTLTDLEVNMANERVRQALVEILDAKLR